MALVAPVGGTTTLSFTVNNGQVVDNFTEMQFTDTLPSGLQVSAMPGVQNTHSGTISAVAGSTLVSLSDGQSADQMGGLLGAGMLLARRKRTR